MMPQKKYFKSSKEPIVVKQTILEPQSIEIKITFANIDQTTGKKMTDDEIKTYCADEYGLNTIEERNAFVFGWREAQKKAGKIIMELKREVKTLGDLVDEYFIEGHDDCNPELKPYFSILNEYLPLSVDEPVKSKLEPEKYDKLSLNDTALYDLVKNSPDIKDRIIKELIKQKAVLTRGLHSTSRH